MLSDKLNENVARIARSEIQMGTGNEVLNFNLIKKWNPSQEISCKN